MILTCGSRRRPAWFPRTWNVETAWKGDAVSPKLDTQVADTPSGRLLGENAGGLIIFRGVRYALPPVGDGRFRAPVPPQSWAGVREALEFGPVPHQFRISKGLLIPESAIELNAREDEDCLHLNVYTPGMGGRRPVLMYIHGGNFVEGAGSQAWTDPAALARRGNVVVVTVNYRLGPLGWLFLEEVATRKRGADSNPGLLDQIAALQWIAKNIASFGGDPDNVTLFGYSAGAWSISALLACRLESRLFHKAIVMSGGVRCHSRSEATTLTTQILGELGVRPRSAETGRLWELPPEAFSAALERVWNRNGHPFPPIRPVAGAAPIPADPLAAIRGGAAADVPILVGSTLEEFKLVATVDTDAARLDAGGLLARLADDLGATNARDLIHAYHEGRRARGEANTPTDLYWAIRSDHVFSVPGIRVAEAQDQAGFPVYMYQVRWAGGDPRLGACHAIDLALMFGTLELEGMQVLSGAGPEAQALSHRIQDAWAAFARTGDPSHAGLPPWPRYDAQHRATMILDRSCHVLEGPSARERASWSGII